MTHSLLQARQAWTDLKYGMFIHFGPNTIQGKAWGDGTFAAEDFNPAGLDPAQWANIALEAGMKYAVLTTKHHDGFCLWPSEHTSYSVRRSARQVDVVRQYTEAFRKAGLKTGLYYSLWDMNCSFYDDDQAYAAYMQNQIRELLTQYGDIVELWFDGAWDKDFPTRTWPYEKAWEKDPASGLLHGQRWYWQELYQLIHQLQPDCLVVNNSSSDRPGAVRYHPVDIRTSEHFNFVYRGQVCQPITDSEVINNLGETVYLPLEYCTSLNPGWFYSKNDAYSHPSAETISGWYQTAQKTNANLLLNVGPDPDGLIPDYHREFLSEAARQLQLI